MSKTGMFDLRLTYTGDYPGHPVAWINDVPLGDEQWLMLLAMFGIASSARRGDLFDMLGAERLSCGLEHEEWRGSVVLVVGTDTNSSPVASSTAPAETLAPV